MTHEFFLSCIHFNLIILIPIAWPIVYIQSRTTYKSNSNQNFFPVHAVTNFSPVIYHSQGTSVVCSAYT